MQNENVFYLGGEGGSAMIVDVPDGADPLMHVWGAMVPGIGPAAATFAASVYEHGTLGLREFEAARLRIAQINGCLFCQDWRTEREGVTVEDSFPEAVEAWRTAPSSVFDDRTRLAAEYAERYAVDHHGLDDGFWSRMKAHYTDVEIVELTMCLGAWLSFGRLNRVLGLDTTCVLPAGLARRQRRTEIAPVDDRGLAGLTATGLSVARADIVTPTYRLPADRRSEEARGDLSAATVVDVDLTVTEEDEQEFGWVHGRAFRCAVGEVASIESSLAIPNMDVDEFATYADDEGGVFRGF